MTTLAPTPWGAHVERVIPLATRPTPDGGDGVRDRRHRELYEHTSDGVFLLDVTGDGRFRIAGFNPAEERLVGLSSAEVSGRFIDELLPVEVARPLLANYRRCVERTATIHYEEVLDLPAGRRWCVTTLVPVLDAAGRVHRIIGVARDVTEERTALEALRASEARFRQLAETIREVFWIVDAATRSLLYVSPAYEAIWGRPCESLRGAPASSATAIHPEDRDRVAALSAKYPGEPTDVTYRILRPDGSERWIRDRSFPVRHDDGPATRIVGIAEDVTDFVRTEEQLRQAQKLEAVGQLAGAVAHDFNNLLSVVLSYADTLFESMATDDPRRDDAAEIRRAGERAADLTRQLLDFSRQQVVQPRLMSFGHTVLSMEKMLRRLISLNVELVLDLAPSTGSVWADPGQIEQVIVNLAVNARDAMPEGGRLVLATFNVTVGAADPSGVAPGAYVLLTARDTGVGMDTATRTRIFEPFFTTKGPGKGTGLGLSTVFGIVQQNGGAIRVDSAPGEGATFRLYFPRACDSSATLPASPEAEVTSVGTETVLVAEDDEQVRSLALSILRRLGYTVLHAQNAGEALLVCEQHDGPIHLLLTDVVMPRMSGRQLAERLAPVRPEMKVLYMSGYPDDSVVRRDVLETRIAFLHKPITPATLGAKVRQVIDSASTAARTPGTGA